MLKRYSLHGSLTLSFSYGILNQLCLNNGYVIKCSGSHLPKANGCAMSLYKNVKEAFLNCMIRRNEKKQTTTKVIK